MLIGLLLVMWSTDAHPVWAQPPREPPATSWDDMMRPEREQRAKILAECEALMGPKERWKCSLPGPAYPPITIIIKRE
jgi:hypothetical protein